MTTPFPTPDNVKKEFVCDAACCIPNKRYRWKIGNSFATALTGFVAGAIAATLALYPWIRFLGEYCPSGVR